MDNKNYLFNIPDELLIAILSFLETYDVLQFFKTFPSLTNILYESQLIKSLNFNQEFRLDEQNLKDFIIFDLTNVTTLCINNIYWIPLEELKKCIKKCKNLTHLSVMDTEMEADKKNCSFIKKNCPKLESLGISVSFNNFYEGTIGNLPSLKTIYLHVMKNWMSMREILDMPPACKKFTSILAFVDYYNFPGFLTRFEGNENSTFRPIVFKEDRCKWEELLEKTLGYDREHQVHIPFGLMDIKYLQRNDYNFENIKIQEFCSLDCTQPDNDCDLPGYKLQYDLLTSPNAKLLKKLAIRYCTIYDHAINCSSKLKDAKCQCSTFQQIVNNCNNLEEIEIWDCKKYNTYFENEALHNIADNPELDNKIIDELHYIIHVYNLKKLSLINIPLNIAKYDFLEKILKNCKKLEYLNVTICSLENLPQNKLFLSLPYGQQLKELRFEDRHLCINSFLQTLNAGNLHKLQQVYISSKANSIDIDIMEAVLKNNPQLIFFGIHNTSMPKQQLIAFQNIMDKYRINNKQKIFCIGNRWLSGDCMIDPNQHLILAPSIYLKEYHDSNTRISVYNFFKNTFLINSTRL